MHAAMNRFHNFFFFIAFLCFLFLFGCVKADLVKVAPNVIGDVICRYAYCGQGTCKRSDDSNFFFDCHCDRGWKQYQAGSLTIPPCILPNCTSDFGCGNNNLSITPPPPSLNPDFSIMDVCSYMFCGEGSCVSNGGLRFRCNCDEGASNLMNSTALPCIKQCTFNASCSGVEFNPFKPSPPDSPANSNDSNSPRSESSHRKNIPVDLQMVMLIVLLLFPVPLA